MAKKWQTGAKPTPNWKLIGTEPFVPGEEDPSQVVKADNEAGEDDEQRARQAGQGQVEDGGDPDSAA